MNFLKQIALKYLKHIGKEAGTERISEVISLLPELENQNYLDYGCSNGDFTIKMAQKIKTNRVSGIEILDRESKKAESKGIKVYKTNLNSKLPFRNNEFDLITAVQVIEHLTDIDTFVSETHRILKPGGYFIVSTENLASLHNIVSLLLGLQPSTGPWISSRFASLGFHPLHEEHIKDHKESSQFKGMDKHTCVMAYRSFKQLFKNYNFSIVEEKTVGYYPFPSFLASFLARFDACHAVDVILKLKKI